MSRTHKHQPWHVRIANPRIRRRIAVQCHHHWTRDGRSLRCDLWTANGQRTCGSRETTGFYSRRWERRRDRHETRHANREQVKQVR